MILNPKRKKAESEQIAPSNPQNLSTHEPKIAHAGVPTLEKKEIEGYPQAFEGSKIATHEPKSATHAAHGYQNPAHGYPANTPQAAHGCGQINQALTMGASKLAPRLMGVSQNALKNLHGYLPKMPRDWTAAPAFEAMLDATRQALTELVQLNHGASRVSVGDGKDRTTQIRGVHVKNEWGYQLDAIAADVTFRDHLRSAAQYCKEHGFEREALWLAAKYRTWRNLVNGHLESQRDELLALRDRFVAGEARIQSGELAADKVEAAGQVLNELARRIALIVDLLDAYRPELIPADLWQEQPTTGRDHLESAPRRHFINEGGWVGIEAKRGAAIATELQAATVDWLVATDDAGRRAAEARYKSAWFGPAQEVAA